MAKAKNKETATATVENVENVEAVEAENVENVEAENVDLIEQFRTETLAPIVEKHGTNVFEIMKSLESHARDFAGDKNKEKRLALLAQGLEVDAESINPNKAGTTALSTMFFNLYQGLEAGENLRDNVLKKATDNTPTESETALVTTFSTLEQASNELRSLTSEDWNKAQSVVMAGFQVSLRYLSTDKVKFPRQCADFLSILIAASNGNTGWFELSDKRIAEITNISPKTVARGRDALVKYQQESGKGVVSIKAETAKPTFYKVNLLEAVSSLIHKAMSGENASTEAMLTVAGVSGRLLTEGTDKVRTEVSDEDLAKAKALNSDLRTAVDSLPEPELVIADNVVATKLAGYKKRFETFRADLGTALEQAHDNGLEATVTALQSLATKAKELGEKLDADGLEPDFATIDAELAKAKAEIAEVGQGKVAEAKAKAEAEKAEKGEVSEETRRAVAQANIEATADLESETANSFENFSQAVYLLAEATADDAEAKQKAYLACIEIVNNAFQLGQYKAQA